jgi:TatD DNase family protein
MMLTDTHCHLYLPEFAEHFEAYKARALQAGVTRIFLPAIDTETHERVIQLAEKSSPQFQLLPMMGLHPCSVKQNFEDELNEVKRLHQSGVKFYAVGEIGLDYYWDTTLKQQQQQVFDAQISLAIELSLPINIHSRSATAGCIEMVSRYKGKSNGIFHCFSGSIEEAKQVIDLGFYLGIGGVVTYKNTNLREVVQAVGLQHIVLETDAPYLSPVPHRGKQNEPSFLKLVAETLAQTLQVSVHEIAEATNKNADAVFNI